MPASGVGPAAQFARTMATAALSHVVTSAFSALLAVYLDEHGLPAIAASGFALGGSYLASVVLASVAHRGFALPAALFLMSIGALMLSGHSSLLLGGAVFAVGSGLFRVAIVVQIARSRAQDMSRERAFSIYTAVVNGGYIVGPFCAELVRARYGWLWVFVAMSVTTGAAFVLSVLSAADSDARDATEQAVTEAQEVPKPATSLVTVLLTVTLFYAIAQVASGNFALVIEKESYTARALLGWTLRAGSLAALHGSFVLVSSLVLSLRTRAWEGSSVARVGLLLYAAAFVLAASLQYPVNQAWILLTFAGLSLAETLAVPTMLAVASRMTAGSRGLYWLAAAAGYGLAGSTGFLWERWSHRQYFATVAFACVFVAALVAWQTHVPDKARTSND